MAVTQMYKRSIFGWESLGYVEALNSSPYHLVVRHHHMEAATSII
jgi:hypothetical protein